MARGRWGRTGMLRGRSRSVSCSRRWPGAFGKASARWHGRWYLPGAVTPGGRNSCWLAEFAGEASPDGMQWLLDFSPWDEDAARYTPARYVARRMGDPVADLAGPVVLANRDGRLPVDGMPQLSCAGRGAVLHGCVPAPERG